MEKTDSYELYEDGKLLGNFTEDEIVKRTGVSHNTFAQYQRNGRAYKGIWTFKKLVETKSMDNSFYVKCALKGWDKVRFKLNPNATGHEKYFRERKSNG